MVKAKKPVPKKTDENDAPAENSVDPADEVNEKPSQENGEVVSAKKKGKGKQAKKEAQPAEPERKSSRTPKPVTTTESSEKPQSGKKKRAASKSPVKSAKKAKPAKKESEDYEVEEIVGLRMKNGKKEFKIRWKGYKPSDDSWEPEKHLSCQDLITEYLESHKDEVEALQAKKSPAKKTPAKASKKGKKSKAK